MPQPSRRGALARLKTQLRRRAGVPLAFAVAAAAPTAAEDRSQSADNYVPAEVTQSLLGMWHAELRDEHGAPISWQIDLRPDGSFERIITHLGGDEVSRAGSYEVDMQTIRLFYLGTDNGEQPNATALNFADAVSLETYFYRIISDEVLALRPTLCRADPCQWTASREP